MGFRSSAREPLEHKPRTLFIDQPLLQPILDPISMDRSGFIEADYVFMEDHGPPVLPVDPFFDLVVTTFHVNTSAPYQTMNRLSEFLYTSIFCGACLNSHAVRLEAFALLAEMADIVYR